MGKGIVAILLTGCLTNPNSKPYGTTIGNALELRIDQLKMPNLDSQPYVRIQLDGTGEWDDDQLEGVVPEPATVGLIGMGLVTALVARRRR